MEEEAERGKGACGLRGSQWRAFLALPVHVLEVRVELHGPHVCVNKSLCLLSLHRHFCVATVNVEGVIVNEHLEGTPRADFTKTDKTDKMSESNQIRLERR